MFSDNLFNKVTPAKACRNWQNLLYMGIPWPKVFCQLRKIHNIMFKWFKIKTNNRILVTNSVLRDMGGSQTIYVNFAIQRKTLSITIYGSVSI